MDPAIVAGVVPTLEEIGASVVKQVEPVVERPDFSVNASA